MTIFEIAEQWSIVNPYREISKDMPYCNEVKYITDKKWEDITSKMDFLDGINEIDARQLFAQINLYSYSQRAKHNYIKVPRPDKVVNSYLKKITNLIAELNSPLFEDDIKNLNALKKKLSNKLLLEMHEVIYPQKPLTKNVIRKYVKSIIDGYHIQVTELDKKDFIDSI